MDLRQVYGDIAKQVVLKNCPDSTQPYLFPHEFDAVIACLFAKSVQIEKALVVDANDEGLAIRNSLASFTSVVLECLEYWNPGWCLRSLKYKRGKFATPAELTAPLRLDILEIVYFEGTHSRKDACIATELLLKRCIEISYILDFDLAIALSDYLRSKADLLSV